MSTNEEIMEVDNHHLTTLRTVTNSVRKQQWALRLVGRDFLSKNRYWYNVTILPHQILINHKGKNGHSAMQKAESQPPGPGHQGQHHMPLMSCSEKSTASFLLCSCQKAWCESGNIDGSYLRHPIERKFSLFKTVKVMKERKD